MLSKKEKNKEKNYDFPLSAASIRLSKNGFLRRIGILLYETGNIPHIF